MSCVVIYAEMFCFLTSIILFCNFIEFITTIFALRNNSNAYYFNRLFRNALRILCLFMSCFCHRFFTLSVPAVIFCAAKLPFSECSKHHSG